MRNKLQSFAGAKFALIAAVLFLFSGSVLAQAPTLPFDFESTTANYTFTDFDGGATTKIANPFPGGINTSANVGKMIKNAGQHWGGSWIALANPIDFSTNKTFKVKVYMPRVGAKLLLKVENATNGAISFEKEATGTVANAWEELTFDYSTINTANSYQKLVIIFDLGTVGNGTADFTYYFDDIKLTSGVSLLQMNLPVTFDLATVDYGVVGFEGAENSTIVPETTLPSNKVVRVVKSATAQPWAGTTVTAVSGGVQTGFATKVPFTATEKRMTVRAFSPHAPIQVRLKVEEYLDPAKTCETEATLTVANSWQTLVFDFGAPATGTPALNLAYNYNKASVFFNFGVNGATAGEKTYYFDDMKFGLEVVPVELTSFTASVSDNAVTLNWATATETNNKGFELQKLRVKSEELNSANWETVAFVAGNGTVSKSRNYSYSDKVAPGKYSYRLKQIDLDGSFTYSQAVETDVVPSSFGLDQNYPNPFNPSTKISFSLPVASKVSVLVYNSLGQIVTELANSTFSAGYNEVNFNAAGLTSGIYFYKLSASSVDGNQNFQSMKKMILMK